MNQFAMIMIIIWLGLPSIIGWLVYCMWDEDK